MSERETSKAIDDDAADWAAKVDRGPLAQEASRALDAWLASDSRRLGAFARARAIAIHSERARALGPTFDPDQFISKAKTAPALSRRSVMSLVGAAAASVAAVAVGVAYSSRGTAYQTRLGEIRLAPLEDGSVITLNTASRVTVGYTDDQRTVRLVAGEAFFEVAKNPDRPFVVLAGDTAVRAVGTSFVVRRLPGQPVEVLVREGLVEVTRRSETNARAVPVAANAKAVSLERGEIAATTAVLEPAAVVRAMSWREGKLTFEGDTLEAAAEEFARYSDIRIVIADPILAKQTITGLFTATDPAGFAQAVAISLAARAEVRNGEVVLSR